MLKIVHNAEPSPKEKVKQRVRRYARPDGMLQCNRCGGRVVMTAKVGVIIRNGRKYGGTTVEKDVCADCFKKGIHSSMMPELIRIK